MSGRQLQQIKFHKSGGELQNGVGVRTKEKTFDDFEESFQQCVSCKSPKDTLYILRGLCKESFMGLC